MLSKTKSKQAGFTLVEIMITLGVAAILLSFGVPRFQGMMMNNRITTNTNLMIGSLNLARSEAIKRGARINVISNNATDWKDGWIIQNDVNKEVIRTVAALNASMNLVGTPVAASYQYQPNGFIGTVAEQIIIVCDSARTGEFGREITIAISGRASVSNRKHKCDPTI